MIRNGLGFFEIITAILVNSDKQINAVATQRAVYVTQLTVKQHRSSICPEN